MYHGAEITRIASKAVRQGFSFEYFPPASPGDDAYWTVRTYRDGIEGVEITDTVLTRAYERWADRVGLSTDPD